MKGGGVHGKGLTEKQKMFVKEYLVDMNATRAYKAVYKSVKSDEVAKVNGSRLLTNANVASYLSEKIDKRSNKLEIKAEDTVREINNIAKANITDILTLVKTQSGAYEMQIEDFDKIPREIKAAIQSIKQNKDGTIEIKMHDKMRALELLGKHQGLLSDNKVEVINEVNVSNPYDGLTPEQLIKLAGMCDKDE